MIDDLTSTSFRDPDSGVIVIESTLYRWFSDKGNSTFRGYIDSGLHQRLIDEKLVLPIFTEPKYINERACYVPERINFIVYPYELSFDVYKDICQCIIKTSLIALEYGYILKDASPYNFQFYDGRIVNIDHGSFDVVEDYNFWPAYEQFINLCMSPLLLSSYYGDEIFKLLLANPNGMNIDFVKRMLPIKAYFDYKVLIHICLLNYFTQTNIGKPSRVSGISRGKNFFLNLFTQLDVFLSKIKRLNTRTQWKNYYFPKGNNYDSVAQDSKLNIVINYFKKNIFNNVLDLGCNDGHYSKAISNLVRGYVVSTDSDYNAVNNLYLYIKSFEEYKNIYPVVQDICAPSPSTGWGNNEHTSFLGRAKYDCVIALAIIHHIVITNSISIQMFASQLSKITKNLVIEFVDPADSMFGIISNSALDVSSRYSRELFETEFKKFFSIVECCQIQNSTRSIYLMETLNV